MGRFLERKGVEWGVQVFERKGGVVYHRTR